MALVEISVRVVQMGLIGGRVAPSPGPADGLWGPLTHESLRSYVASAAGSMGLDAARVLAPLRNVPARSRSIELPNEIASHLERMAGQYRDVQREVQPAVQTPTATIPAVTTQQAGSTPVWPWVVGGLVVFGLGYWAYRRFA